MVEEDLIICMQKGDGDSFSQIYEIYKNRLYYHAINKVGNSQDAEDIVQTTFIEAYKSVPNLKEPKAFKAFIYTILRRNCYKFYTSDEKNKSEIEYIDGGFDLPEDEELDSNPNYSLITKETKDSVMRLIEALPDEQRECIMLYYFEEMGTREIAEVLDISEGTVKSRLNYARKKIKTEIEESRRKGLPIISLFPLPLLVYLLREFADQNKLSVRVSTDIAKGIGQACGITMPQATGSIGTSGMQAVTTTQAGTGAQAAAAATKAGMSTLTKVLIGLTAAGVMYVAAKPPEEADIRLIEPSTVEIQSTIEPYAEHVMKETKSAIMGLSETEDITEEDLTLPKQPKSWSDYAKIYYEYVQTGLKIREDMEFIDAEMADIDADGNPELLAYFKKDNSSDSNVQIEFYTIQLNNTDYVESNSHFIDKYDQSMWYLHKISMPININSYTKSPGFFLCNEDGRIVLCYYKKRGTIDPLTNNMNVNFELNVRDFVKSNGYLYTISHINGRYSGYSSESGAHQYDAAKDIIDKYMSSQYGTWGYTFVDIEGLTFVNTGGERLKDYFKE